MKRYYALASSCWLIMIALCAPVSGQTLSDAMKDGLKNMASEQLNADLALGTLDVNSLTDGLTANNIRLATRVKALSEPENQLLLAKQLVLTGDWQSLGNDRVAITKVEVSDAQLTVAYYDTGESNLHALLRKMSQLQVQKVNATPLSWQVDDWVMKNVTINLFDQGNPILSVHVGQLALTDLQSMQDPDAQVKELLWPILEQVAAQIRQGNSSLQVDSLALSQFLLREAMAF